MKKTIIALMALSCVATAGTTNRISSYGTNTSVITTSAAKSSVTATSLIDLASLQLITTKGDTYDDTALLGIKIASNTDFSISVGSFSVNNVPTVQLRIYNKAAGETISGAGTQFSWKDDEGNTLSTAPYLNDIDLTNAVQGAITLGYNPSSVPNVTDIGTAVVFSVLYENGSILSYYGIASSQYWSSGHVASITYDSDVLATPELSVWSSPWTRESLITANQTALVPEPTTATLSLLALAGLAARRRRR